VLAHIRHNFKNRFRDISFGRPMHNAPINVIPPLPQVWAEGGGWSGLVGELIAVIARGGGDL